jgi:citrate lyase subunit beta/citryl-CoA lyase
MHPSDVLFQGTRLPRVLPVCDHYAGSEKLMRKSLALQQAMGPVFDITFDCEDGAAAGNEEAHARLIGSLIAGQDNRFGRISARVHDAQHPHFAQDVRLICEAAAAKLAFLTLPKVEDLAAARQALAVIAQHAAAAGRTDLPVHLLIETQGALADVFAIAALPQVESLSFGIMDFVSSHYGAIPAAAMSSPAQFSHPLVVRAKLEIAAACHAHGKVASHNVTTEIRDMTVVANDAARAGAEFGYTRMWSIHPDQIAPILASFAPRTSEIEEAAAILAGAQANQWGPIQHQGKLHDRASYRYYWTILQRAKAAGLTLPETAAGLV